MRRCNADERGVVVRAVLVLALGLPTKSDAQVVRGVITERASGSAVAGVLVTLERSAAAGVAPISMSAVSVLTDERGEYAARASAAGRYRLSAKRIGVKRYVSEEFGLAEGETVRMDAALDAVLYNLPEILITGNTLCTTRRDQARRVASLWDEARTALTATQISARDHLVEARITRYRLALDPRSLAVLSESRHETDGAAANVFTSLSGDTLSQIGYWRDLHGDSVEFYGPDGEVLLSPAFLQDHCFGVVQGGRDRQGLTGLSFAPVPSRELPDVRGTLWLDGRTFELRFVEFRYTRLPFLDAEGRVGGEVHFARLPNGAWIVKRWFIRMPQFARDLSAPAALREALDALSTVSRFVETGGSVTTDALPAPVAPSAIIGVVLDSSGAPLVGASVRLAGAPFATMVDDVGRFRFDGVPPGSHAVIAQHDGYAILGVVAAQSRLTLGEGATARVTLRAQRTRDVITGLCDGRRPAPRRATLRVIMVDSATSTPFPDVPFRVSWVEPNRSGGVTWREQRLNRTTDRDGVVTFCGLPAHIPLELSIVPDNASPRRVSVFNLAQNELTTKVVSARIPQ